MGGREHAEVGVSLPPLRRDPDPLGCVIRHRFDVYFLVMIYYECLFIALPTYTCKIGVGASPLVCCLLTPAHYMG